MVIYKYFQTQKFNEKKEGENVNYYTFAFSPFRIDMLGLGQPKPYAF